MQKSPFGISMAPLLGDWLKPLWKLQSLEASSSGSVAWSSAITDTQSICMWGNAQWDVKDWTHERTRPPSLCPLNVTQARPPLDDERSGKHLSMRITCGHPHCHHHTTTTVDSLRFHWPANRTFRYISLGNSEENAAWHSWGIVLHRSEQSLIKSRCP